jgi:ESF2/ABP1 family protein
MTTRKHNDFLDIAASDDEASASDRGYDSEANAAESKGRAVKRRRTTTRASLSSGSDEDEDQDQDHKDGSEDEDTNEDGGALLDVSEEPSTSTKKPAKSLKAKDKLAKLAKPPKKDKSGVIYCESYANSARYRTCYPDQLADNHQSLLSLHTSNPSR